MGGWMGRQKRWRGTERLPRVREHGSARRAGIRQAPAATCRCRMQQEHSIQRRCCSHLHSILTSPSCRSLSMLLMGFWPFPLGADVVTLGGNWKTMGPRWGRRRVQLAQNRPQLSLNASSMLSRLRCVYSWGACRFNLGEGWGGGSWASSQRWQIPG